MRRYITLDRMDTLLARGLHMGARRKGELAHRWEWDVSGNCRSAIDVQLIARTEYKQRGPAFYRVHPTEARSVMLDMQVRCRTCEECRAAKARHWSFRAQEEIRAWPRTWLGTLTLSTEWHYQMKLRASRHLDKNGIRFEDLDTAEQFQLRCAEIGKELQLFQKRFRKAAGGKYRLLVVFEKHDGKRGPPGAVYGLPHVHMLVHECDPLAPVRKRTLEAQWRLGFSSWKLVDKETPSSGSYVCKYIAKENLSRVRASQFYGLTSETTSVHRDIFTENNPWEEIRPQKRKALF